MRRFFALLLGGLGLRALLRRRPQPVVGPSPVDDLRAKLAETRAAEPAPSPEPAPGDVAGRRADVHERARRAMGELRDEGE